MVWRRRHPCGEHVSSGSIVVMALALTPERSGAREVVQESVQTAVCVGDNWKMVNLVLGLWLKVARSGFLLRWCRAGVPELEFDSVSRVLP
jgi:hypothetical protein